MHCRQTQIQLKAYLDGELSGWQQRRVVRHLQQCETCAARLTTLQRLHTLLHQADILEPLPPYREADRATVGGNKMVLRTLWGGGITAALAIGLLTLPRSHKVESMAAEVQQALKKTNTWHLKGWKRLGERTVAWEIWGQQQPYFYREEAEDKRVRDDGTTRTLVLPPREGIREKGVVLKMPSSVHPLYASPDGKAVWTSPLNLSPHEESNWTPLKVDDWRTFLQPVSQTKQEAVFRFTDGGSVQTERYYTVRKRDWLPVRYEMRLSQGKHVWTAESLHIDYPPLPESAKQPLVGEDTYPIVDMTRSGIGDTIPHENVGTSGSLTIQIEPLVMDRQGRLLARMRGWLGGTPLDSNTPLSLRTSLLQAAYADENPASLYLLSSVLERRDTNEHTVLFVPLTPLKSGESPPRSLTTRLVPYVSILTATSGVANQRHYSHLYRQLLTVTTTLPVPVESFQIAPYVTTNPSVARPFKGSKQVPVTSETVLTSNDTITLGSIGLLQESLEAVACATRAQHYRLHPAPSSDLAAYWYRQAIAQARTTDGLTYRANLVYHYRERGKIAEARQVVAEMRQAIGQFPQRRAFYEEWVRSLERSLPPTRR